MKSFLAITTIVLALCCLARSSSASDQPGRLSIYAQSGTAVTGFEPRPLATRERELIRQILEAGAGFQATYVPDVVTGKVDALDQVGARFGSFTLLSGSAETSERVRPLVDELALPVTLSLGTSPPAGARQLRAWSGCPHVRAIFMLSPELAAADLELLAEFPGLTNLQLGSPGHTRTDRRRRSGRTVRSADRLEIDNTAIAALARVPELQLLQIYDLIVTADNFDGLQNIRRLRIEGVELNQQAFASCAELSQIEALSFARSRATLEAPIDLSGLRHVRTLKLPQLAADFEQTRELAVGLDELAELKTLGFTGLHHSGGWPPFEHLPAKIEWVELYDSVFDAFDGLGFVDARLQVQNLRFRRSPDSGNFDPLEAPGFRFDISGASRIAGRQVESIRVGGREFPPAEFTIVRFGQWTTEAQFLNGATVEQLEFESFSREQQQHARELARFGLRVGSEQLPGGIIMRPLVDVELQWNEPALLAEDIPRIVDAMVRLPLQKLTIRTDEFPLERLTELQQVDTLSIFELHREGLTDVHLLAIQAWSHLEELTIHSPGNTFSREGLELLAESLPKCDLKITGGQPGRPPLLWRKKPPAGVKKPPIEF
jgi:hypothetical protein